MNEVDNMHQDDINKDLGHYIKEKHKSTPFWKKVFKERSKQEVQEEIKEELMEAEQNEDIHPEDKKELEEIEHKIEEVNKVEDDVEEKISIEREGLLKRFFKKLNFSEKNDAEEYEEDETEEHGSTTDEEMKEFLKTMHTWITKLDPETQKEFKRSKDFELYTAMLKKHDLIK
ncbi:TPA: hypothetical protein HA235_01905 [Candidatus Woesearchaeota archaeon]|nr:hypothetical protein [Candidatus Woesearchaeota archaeon]HIH31439.1 hypothetical protein [Candidatus Woesearchaeota archaeon]HIH54776.1 hypothetical protein [Candidatus Woesearchaeota archaeon]HIJ01277.1 hypothetical protein [Candidatus Woesearchaeota archaeon]HIJ13682.1 hypothetical protein [Candidatus Woesearchaeota archaeon]